MSKLLATFLASWMSQRSKSRTSINTDELDAFSHYEYYVRNPTVDRPAIPIRVLCDDEGFAMAAEEAEIGTGKMIPNLGLLTEIREYLSVNECTEAEFNDLREALIQTS